MLKNIRQSLYNPNCLSCGSYFVHNHLFCDYCYTVKIEPKLDLKKHSFASGNVAYSIFDWNPGESDLLSEMVYRFKSDRSILAWRHYSELAIKAFSYEMDPTEFSYVVPIPGSKKTSVHAGVFAAIVSEIIKKPVLDILIKPKSDDQNKEQKLKSKAERSLNQFRLREEFTQNFDYLDITNKRILLVDDIITTGNSYNQCLQVIGTSKPSALLTLFYRTINSKGVLVS